MDILDNFAQLNQSIRANLVWKPSITLLSSHFQQSLDDKISPNATNPTKQLVNITNFLDNTINNTISLSSFRLALAYPPNAVLEIEGFVGLAEESKVLSKLKNAALAGGTVLVTESVNKGRRLVFCCSPHHISSCVLRNWCDRLVPRIICLQPLPITVPLNACPHALS
jgi:hypothetical protein